MLLELHYQDNKIVIIPIPQIGFTREGKSGLHFISENELSDINKPMPKDINPDKCKFLIIADSEEAEYRLINVLKKRGISFKYDKKIQIPFKKGDTIPVEIHTIVDTTIKRCAAKIAFNYLTKIHGANFALRTDFNIVRSFIRYGIQPRYPLVVIDNITILEDDNINYRQTNGHIIALNWASDKRTILAKVSFFNDIRYRIILSPDFKGVWREIRSGHHFNISNREIESCIGVSRSLLL